MLGRHHGLTILLLGAVAAHATLVQHFLGRQPPYMQLGFAVILVPLLLPLLGGWITDDAETVAGQRTGHALSAIGASLHLLLDLGCLALPWLVTESAWFYIAGAAVGAIVMGLVLREALLGLAGQAAATKQRRGAWGKLVTEVELFGGTPIALVLVCAGFVTLALVGAIRRGAMPPSMIGAAAFFACCGLVGVAMGLDRRALLLGEPSPLARLRPRWLRGGSARVCKDGLALTDRRGATLYAWPSILAIAPGMFMNSSALLVTLEDGAPAVRVDKLGAIARADVLRSWEKSEARSRSLVRALIGADLAILSAMTEDGAGALYTAVENAMLDEAVRATLPSFAEICRRAP